MGFLKAIGCATKVLLGLAGFFGGAVGVLVLGTPYSFGRGAVAGLVDEFNEAFQGRLELRGSHVFDAFGPQELAHFELRDPDGIMVARGAARSNSLRGWMDEGIELTIELDELYLVRDDEGTTNLERTFEPRSTTRTTRVDEFEAHGRQSTRTSIVTIEGTTASPGSLARLVFERVTALDLSIHELMFEDQTCEPPALLEGRQVDATLRRRDSGRSLGAGGTLAEGNLDLRADLGDWDADDPFPEWRTLDVSLDGASSHQLDPWFERAFGRRLLAAHVGPRLSRVSARFEQEDEVATGTLGLVADGVRVDCSGALVGGYLHTDDEGGLALTFADDSRFSEWVVPRLLPFVESRTELGDGSESSIHGESMIVSLWQREPTFGGHLTAKLATRSFVPAVEFRGIREFEGVGTWNLSDESIPIVVEEGEVRFESACEAVLEKDGAPARWLVHGHGQLGTPDIEAAVRLSPTQSDSGKPVTVVVRVLDGKTVREYKSD